MRNSITNLIIWILLVSTNSAFAQLPMDCALLRLEREIAATNNDTLKTARYIQKIALYLLNKEYSADAFTEIRRVNYTLLDSAAKASFLWNAALMAQLTDEEWFANYYYSLYQTACKDSSKQAALLQILIKRNSDANLVAATIKRLSMSDTSFNCLKCLYNAESSSNSTLPYVIASAIVPGLGSMLNGNIVKGLGSFTVNSAAVYGIYLLIQSNLYINALFWGVGVGVKFYIGNLYLTNRLVEEKNATKKSLLAKACKEKLQKLTAAYPLTFK